MLKKIEISHRTILFTLAVLAGTWLVLQVRDILYLLFVAFILTTGLRPLVDFLARHKVPRVVAILLTYIVLIGVIGGIFATTIPTIIYQSNRLIQDFPSIIERVFPATDLNIRTLTQEIAPFTQNVVRVGFEIVNNVVSLVTILVFTFYFLLERASFKQTLRSFLGEETTQFIAVLVTEVEQKLGTWLRGQLTLMLVIGILSYVGLLVLRVDYALPLALIAGLLEVVPMVGPIIGAFPAVIYALTISPLLALSVAALYFIIQQFENHLIVPYVMKKSVGLSPVITIVAFLIGARFEGVVGALLAVPAILVAQVVVARLLEERKEINNK
jgi:predicted PurR-regulated permease PerM